mgnify:CR=1 FL=1
MVPAPIREIHDVAVPTVVERLVASGTDLAVEPPPDALLHWAFQPLKQVPPPSVHQASWCRTDIDRFILARLEKEGIAPSPDATKATLLRRVSLDLTGLPATPQETAAFLADTRPGALERQVDRYVDSGQSVRAGRLRTLLPIIRSVLLVALGIIVIFTVLSQIGVNVAPRIKTLKVSEPPKRSAGIKVADVATLVDKLKNVAKVI